MLNEQTLKDEPQSVVERYRKRDVGNRYSILRPEIYLGMHERQQRMLHLFGKQLGWTDFANKKLIEVGCGAGGNLLEFLRFGFLAKNLIGIELLPERALYSRKILPSELVIHEGDANSLEVAPESQDIVYQSVVFSSLLRDDFQKSLADRMWSWVKPGGGILWYDFIYSNPRSQEVRSMPLSRVKELFPEGEFSYQRLTLAPPISRRICQIHPSAYHVFNAFPFLRSHVLCWIQKK